MVLLYQQFDGLIITPTRLTQPYPYLTQGCNYNVATNGHSLQKRQHFMKFSTSLSKGGMNSTRGCVTAYNH